MCFEDEDLPSRCFKYIFARTQRIIAAATSNKYTKQEERAILQLTHAIIYNHRWHQRYVVDFFEVVESLDKFWDICRINQPNIDLGINIVAGLWKMRDMEIGFEIKDWMTRGLTCLQVILLMFLLCKLVVYLFVFCFFFYRISSNTHLNPISKVVLQYFCINRDGWTILIAMFVTNIWKTC